MRKLSEIFTIGLGRLEIDDPGMCGVLTDLLRDHRITLPECRAAKEYIFEYLWERAPGITIAYVTHYLYFNFPSCPTSRDELGALRREFYFFLIWDLARRGN